MYGLYDVDSFTQNFILYVMEGLQACSEGTSHILFLTIKGNLLNVLVISVPFLCFALDNMWINVTSPESGYQVYEG